MSGLTLWRARRGQARGSRMPACERTQERSGIRNGLIENEAASRPRATKGRCTMCPACLANVGFITAGAASTSGLAALAVKRALWKWQEKLSTKRNWRRTNENRTNGTENTRKRIESV